jgi:hypothetical protein
VFFRIYPLDDRGHYRLPIEVECATDAEAAMAGAALAARIPNGFDLWQLSRFVGRYAVGPAGLPNALPNPTSPLAPPN